MENVCSGEGDFTRLTRHGSCCLLYWIYGGAREVQSDWLEQRGELHFLSCFSHTASFSPFLLALEHDEAHNKMASSHGKNDSDPAQSTPNTVPLPSSSTHRASVLPTNLQQATTNLADLAISPERPKRANLPQSLFGLQNLAKGNAAPDEGRDGGSVQEGTNEESETPKEGAYENWLAAQRAKNTYAAFQQAVVGLKPAVVRPPFLPVVSAWTDEAECRNRSRSRWWI